MRSPIKWFGGKGKQVKTLVKLIPAHQVYVEPFAGGASLFFAKEPARLEVLNDLDGNIFNFYSVLRDPDKAVRLQDVLQATPYSVNEYQFALEYLDGDCLDDVERARCFFVKQRQGFGGGVSNTGWSRETGVAVHNRSVPYWSAIDGLHNFHSRIRDAQVDSIPAVDLITRMDSLQTFFYLDPPYILGTRVSGGYNHEMTDAQHDEMVDVLLALKGKALLSGYENPIYKRLDDAGWRMQSFTDRTHSAYALTGKTRTECLWMNYEPPAVQTAIQWLDDADAA